MLESQAAVGNGRAVRTDPGSMAAFTRTRAKEPSAAQKVASRG